MNWATYNRMMIFRCLDLILTSQRQFEKNDKVSFDIFFVQCFYQNTEYVTTLT